MDIVLVVDNNLDFLKSLKNTFSSLHQFGMKEALNGEEALKILSSERISVFVTDINAEKVDGLELLAYISQNHQGMPCIVMSSYGRPWFYKPLEQKEILYHLKKPVSMVSLVSAILVGLSLKDEEGVSRGMSLKTFLPLLEIERKTCRLEVQSQGKKGYLYFDEGILIDAHYKQYSSESAASEMMQWENCSIHLGELPRRRYQKRVNVPLMEMAGATWKKDFSDPNITDEKVSTPSKLNSGKEIATAATRIRYGKPILVTPGMDENIGLTQQVGIKVLNSQIEKFKSIRGYLAIGILDQNLTLISSDNSNNELDLTDLAKAFKPILSYCSEITEKYGFSECKLSTFHTGSTVIQILNSFHKNLTPFYLIGITESVGNWFFMKFELENLENQLVLAMKKPINIK
jgi:CheY-like chemotaxis protein